MTDNEVPVLLSVADGVGVVRLNRKSQRNALSHAMVGEIALTLDALATRDDVRVVVITGDEIAFSSGQDLKDPTGLEFSIELNELLLSIGLLPKPVIAAISGWCIAGGLELAMACDFRVATRTAKIGDWHAKINSLGGGGAIPRLIHMLGVARATEMILTGDVMSGERAFEIGLVHDVCNDGDQLLAARRLAERLMAVAPTTLAYAKQAIRLVADLPLTNAIHISLRLQDEFLSITSGDLVADFEHRRSEPKGR